MEPWTFSVLADLRLEGGVGTCNPPSVNPGPQVIPALGVLFLFRLMAELEVFLFPRVSLSLLISGRGSSIVLEGEPGVGGVFDRDDLRAVNVKLIGRLFDSWDGARTRGVLRGSLRSSVGAYWSITLSARELVRLRKLVAFLKTPGLFSFCEGDKDSTGVTLVMLVLLLVRGERGIVGGCSIVGLCERGLICCFGGFTFAVWIGMSRGVGVLRSMVFASADRMGRLLSKSCLFVFICRN